MWRAVGRRFCQLGWHCGLQRRASVDLWVDLKWLMRPKVLTWSERARDKWCHGLWVTRPEPPPAVVVLLVMVVGYASSNPPSLGLASLLSLFFLCSWCLEHPSLQVRGRMQMAHWRNLGQTHSLSLSILLIIKNCRWLDLNSLWRPIGSVTSVAGFAPTGFRLLLHKKWKWSI